MCLELYRTVNLGGKAMDFLFYAVPALIMAGAIFLAVHVVRRALRIRSAWNSGLTAEARCLRTFTTTHGGRNNTSVRTTLHHVYEFTTRDGRLIRFEEEDGPGTVIEGDIVTVHYTEGSEVVATAHRPSHAKVVAATAGILVFLGVIVVFCVGFMVVNSQVFGPIDDFMFGTDDNYSDVPDDCLDAGDSFPDVPDDCLVSDDGFSDVP